MQLHSDMNNPIPESANDNPTPVAVRRGGRFWTLFGGVVVGLVLLLCALFFWAVKTEAGTKVLFSVAHYLTAGHLTVDDVHGSLGDDLEVSNMTFHSASLKIEARGIHLTWQPSALWQQRAVVDRLYVTSLRVASQSDHTPATLPSRLALPFDLDARDLAVGELIIADIDQEQRQTEVVQLSALTGALRFDHGRYQGHVIGTTPWGRVDVSSLRLDGAAPYPIQATATWSGHVLSDKPAVKLAVTAGGDLQLIKLTALAQLASATTNAKQLSGQASASVAPFAQETLSQLDIDLQHVDPSMWVASAPAADLTLKLNAHPDATKKNKTGLLTGRFTAVNAAAAALSQHGVPVTQLSSQFVLDGTALQLSALQVALAGDGTIRGSVNLDWQTAQPKADARLQLNHINLLKIDEHLRQSAISGELTATTPNQDTIQVRAQLRDVAALLNVDLQYGIRQRLLNLNQFHLASHDSSIDGQGDFSFDAQQAFHVKGVLKNVDPAKWLAVPAGHLNAAFSSTGQISPDVRVSAQVSHLSGQYAGKVVEANADLQWHNGEATVRQLDARWGSNVMSAQGAWGGANDALNVHLNAPQLSELNVLLAKTPLSVQGDVNADLVLQGKIAAPAGQLTMHAGSLRITTAAQVYSLQDLDGKLNVSPTTEGVVDGEITAHHLRADAAPVTDVEDKIEQVQLRLKGRRSAHDIALTFALPGQRRIAAQFGGGLHTQVTNKIETQSWDGQLQSLVLHGKTDARLVNPTALHISPEKISVGNVQITSDLAHFTLEQLVWTPQSLQTSGHVSDAKVTDLLNLVKPQYAVTGGLQLNADWNIELGDIVRGQIHIQRQSGDLRFSDPDGTGTPIPLGIKELNVQMRLGGLVAGTNGQRLAMTLDADGIRLGQVHVKGDTLLEKQNGAWTVLPTAPLNGKVNAVLPDLEWVGSWINPGVVLKGRLNLDATVAGQLGTPHYHADLAGREIEFAFASEGLLLPNGVLDAQIDDAHLKLTRLQFSNKVTSLPQHEQFKGWDIMGQRGEFNASGELDIGRETGSISAQWQQFPLLQRKDRWLLISGQVSISEANNIWSLNGKVLADGAYFKLPKLPPPSLSSDVHVNRKTDKLAVKNGDPANNKKGLKTRVDVSFNVGSRFVFVGRGLDTGLSGSLRLRSIDGSPLQATGSINTVKGFYEGYGQQLTIDRGILNFQGPPANPGLNIRALRQGLPVEAGVEVVGTVVAPQVRLVSEPDVPDAEKLTWLVLGRGSDQLAGGDASLLMSAATAIFGGDGSRNVPKSIVQGLGFDEFSIGNASGTPSSHVPGQTVAGATSTSTTSSTSTDQVVSVGKHLMPGLVLAVERGLGDASGAVKLSWQLTRRITIIGRTGSESAVDINYTFSFN